VMMKILQRHLKLTLCSFLGKIRGHWSFVPWSSGRQRLLRRHWLLRIDPYPWMRMVISWLYLVFYLSPTWVVGIESIHSVRWLYNVFQPKICVPVFSICFWKSSGWVISKYCDCR